MIGIGIIGYGYWGPNLARNFMSTTGAKLVAVCDRRQERLDVAGCMYPAVKLVSDCNDLISDPDVHAVAVATPVSSHFELAMRALEAGKHVLVEKPMTSTSEEGQILVREAAKRNLVLQVDHTFIYTGAVRRIKELVDCRELGSIYYYDSTRVNLGLFQHDVDVIWDLAVHDLSIVDYVFKESPIGVAATGAKHVENAPENIAYLTLFFDSQLIAHINVNWLSPVKLRRTLLCGDKKMVVYDELEPTEKVKVYDSGIMVNTDDIYQVQIDYRTGDMWAPKLENVEALQAEVCHFVDCIETGVKPYTSGEMGLRIVRILEAASESMKNYGALVKL